MVRLLEGNGGRWVVVIDNGDEGGRWRENGDGERKVENNNNDDKNK